MRVVRWLAFVVWGFAAIEAADEPLIGKAAPEFGVVEWIHSRPLKLADLRGKVVLVRWFTGAHCPYCKTTAPALNEFHERFASKGLQVIGMYHHKSDDPFDRDTVERLADDYRFKFPVAIDADWATLHRWWLDAAPKRAWTSVTFLIDRRGRIRHIHAGGQYVKGDRDYQVLLEKITALLDEK